jgi:thioredoxin 1
MADTPVPAVAAESGSSLLVACLCAQWCGTCRDYRAVFDALAAEVRDESLRSGQELLPRFVWVDIEDQADVLGDVDVEDFPTLLIARGDVLLFLGPLTPQPATLVRLVRSALAGGLAALGDVQHAGLPARLRAL